MDIEQQVNELAGKLVAGEDGSLQVPDGVEASEELLFAAKVEKRRRDTQSAFTKASTEAKQLRAENETLAKSWEQDAVANLSSKEQARLEELKVQDPDSWRSEITKLEEEKRNQFKTKREELSQKARSQTETERRAEVLAEWQKSNPDIELTDEVVENDIPPRITKKLESGDITFEEFLEQSKQYLTKGKTLEPGAVVDPEPGFATARGGARPSEDAVTKASSSEYAQEVF